MKNKTTLFLIYLAILSIAYILISSILRCYIEVNGVKYFWLPLLNFIYAITPVIAVIIVGKLSFREMCKEYLITLKNVNWGAFTKYVLAFLVLFPALVLLLNLLIGTVFGVAGFGKVMLQSANTLYNGVPMPDNSILRFCLLFVCSAGITLLAAIVSLPCTIGGEIGWRGFLEKNITQNYFKKNLLIGLIWGTWFMPFILLGHNEYSMDTFFTIIFVYLTSIVLSFILSDSLKKTGTIFTPAVIVGVIHSLLFFSIFQTGGKGFLVGYQNSLLGVASLLLILFLFRDKLKVSK